MLLRLWLQQATPNIFLLQSRRRDKVTSGNMSPLPCQEDSQPGCGWAHHTDSNAMEMANCSHYLFRLHRTLSVFCRSVSFIKIFVLIYLPLWSHPCWGWPAARTGIWLQHTLHAGSKLMNAPAAAQHQLCSKGYWWLAPGWPGREAIPTPCETKWWPGCPTSTQQGG